MKKTYQDKIDDYLMDRMTEDERLVFEEEIENNMEIWEQLKFTEMVQRALKNKDGKNFM